LLPKCALFWWWGTIDGWERWGRHSVFRCKINLSVCRHWETGFGAKRARARTERILYYNILCWYILYIPPRRLVINRAESNWVPKIYITCSTRFRIPHTHTHTHTADCLSVCSRRRWWVVCIGKCIVLYRYVNIYNI